MTPTELGILAMALPMLALAIHIYLQKRGTRRLRDFRRTLDTVLLPRETVPVSYTHLRAHETP